jgi:DNA-nicking Smr family endonuclease
MASSRPEAGLDEAGLSFVRNGYPPGILRRLRRGHWRVEDSLDLHGMNRIEAERAVGDFVGRARERGLECVCIVHGRALGREPVLKSKLRGWLTARGEVLAFSPAPAAHGGAGAVLVLLKA